MKNPPHYHQVRAHAQQDANAFGIDIGLFRDERGDFYRRFLPRRDQRSDVELTCEVVSCEDLTRCLPGHGPTT